MISGPVGTSPEPSGSAEVISMGLGLSVLVDLSALVDISGLVDLSVLEVTSSGGLEAGGPVTEGIGVVKLSFLKSHVLQKSIYNN